MTFHSDCLQFNGDNLDEVSNHVSWENKKHITYLSSAELAQMVVKVNDSEDVISGSVFRATWGDKSKQNL